jgi:Zn-dependent alcohol dehydrogenase
MEIEAAVFRRVQEPLTIEAVEIDKPWGPRGAGSHGGHRRLP